MSKQQDAYLAARADGLSIPDACFEADVPPGEAALIEEALARGELSLNSRPPLQDPTAAGGSGTAPPAGDRQRSTGREAYPTGAMEANGGNHPKENETMARTAKKKDEEGGIIAAPDFDLAVSIYRKDIKPAASKVGEHAQEMSEAYKAIKKRANIQPQAAKLAFKLDDMEESKRDDFLRSLNGLLKKLNIFMPVDLVDAAEGKDGTSDDVIPAGKSRKPQLVTVPSHPADDSDLVEAAE